MSVILPSVQVFVERSREFDFEYEVRIWQPGAEEVTRKISLGPRTETLMDLTGTFDPFELGFERTDIGAQQTIECRGCDGSHPGSRDAAIPAGLCTKNCRTFSEEFQRANVFVDLR